MKQRTGKYKAKVFQLFRNFQRSSFYLPLLIALPSYCILAIAIYVIEQSSPENQFSSLQDSFWWAMVTASTVGYGDIVPKTTAGRVLAGLTTLMGFAVTTLISAALASLFIQRNSLWRKGLMEFPKLKNHLVICGWKSHISSLLKDLLDNDQDLMDEDIVLISNIDGETFETMVEEPQLRGVKFVHGDYCSEVYLEKANVKKARKVLVLADTYDSKTSAETDAKTVLAVLKIKGISRNIYTCAELLDPKYEDYLRRSFCDEIILVRDASRQLLVVSSKIDGMSHVIQNLLSLHESEHNVVCINASSVPHHLVGKEYNEVQKLYNNNKKIILLGLIENSGTAKDIQKWLIRKAQKENSVKDVLRYINEAKSIELNKPFFMPEENYIIKPFSKLIFLERQN